MAQLLSSFGKRGVELGLNTLQVDIEDTTYLSKYFVISEFNPVFTGGKNPVAFNGSTLLKPDSEIQVECLDSAGNSLYIERPKSNIAYQDIANFVISVHIYNETYNGAGTLIFVGTTVKNEIVRWKSNITIDKTLQNASKVRFYNKPTIEARGLLYPVVSNDAGTSLTKTISLNGSFYSLPVTPAKDTNRKSINPKKTDMDYRIVYSGAPNGSTLYPTTSFNTQMEGQPISIVSNTIQVPFSYTKKNEGISSSFKIKKVLDSRTLQVDDAFFYTVGKDQFVTSIDVGKFNASYTWIAYNTASDDYLKYTDTATGTTTYSKESYAEITYRNIRPFSGFIARHKLYRKSLVYPGDFQLIADEPLGALELLTDPVTNNKTYNLMGTFYNQVHINKYWFTSSNTTQLIHSVSPYINALKFSAAQYSDMNGAIYAIAKADSAETTNNAIYYPYDSASFNNISGLSYNSNFISLKKDSLYVLSTNVVLEKDKTATDVKVTFYFTSSIPEIKLEKNYITPFGLKLGEISTTDQTATKIFADKQMLYFTPTADYYGTLIVVPYHCNVTLSELSLKVYGDYGFSPDILFTKIPFSVHIPNEPFELKSELFDINSTLVYSDLKTIQSFDGNGDSLFAGNSSDPSLVTFVSGSLTISKSLYLPNIPQCSTNIRLLGFRVPTHHPPNPSAGDGQVCYTDVTNLSNLPGEYVNLSTYNGVTTTIGRSIAVKYTGSSADGGPYGRRVWVDLGGTKTIYS